MAHAKKQTPEEPLPKKLWKAAEYKHVVLGRIFLKYIPDAFEELHAKHVAGEGDFAGADPEDRHGYLA